MIADIVEHDHLKPLGPRETQNFTGHMHTIYDTTVSPPKPKAFGVMVGTGMHVTLDLQQVLRTARDAAELLDWKGSGA